MSRPEIIRDDKGEGRGNGTSSGLPVINPQTRTVDSARLCGRIIGRACTLVESQWLAPRERMALFNNSDSPRQLGVEGDP